MKYDILIASPGTDFVAEYVESLTQTINDCGRKGLTVKWMNGQSSLVHHARELTATGGGRVLDPNDTGPCKGVDYSVIVWIDSDISWTPDDFSRLINSPYEVTTGVYLIIDGTTTVHTPQYLGGIPRELIKQMDNPIKIQSCGFGFMAMKKGVFERIKRPWFNHEYQKVGENNGNDVIDCLGEDISWCVKAYREKIDIWFDPKIRVTHHKRMPLKF